jgi:hypothetical protein
MNLITVDRVSKAPKLHQYKLVHHSAPFIGFANLFASTSRAYLVGGFSCRRCNVSSHQDQEPPPLGGKTPFSACPGGTAMGIGLALQALFLQ